MPFQSFGNQFGNQLQYLSRTWDLSPEVYFALTCLALIFIRTLMMLMVIPFIGSRSVPARVKVMTAAALTGFLYPLLKPSFDISQFSGWDAVLIGLFLKESLVGFTIGLMASLVFYGIQAAGLMIDNQRGVANAQVFVPQLGTQGSIFGLLQFQAAVALFIVIGGHRQFLEAFFEGFLILPIFHFPTFATTSGSFFDLFIHLTGDVLVLAVKISAPVIIAIFLADVVLGIANKVAPAINVFELGFSIKGIVGVFIVYISILILYDEFGNVTLQMVSRIRDAFKLLGM